MGEIFFLKHIQALWERTDRLCSVCGKAVLERACVGEGQAALAVLSGPEWPGAERPLQREICFLSHGSSFRVFLYVVVCVFF